MKIRKAKLQDINKIHSLGENVEEFNTTEDVVIFWPKSILKNCIKSKKDFIFIAEEKEILGFIIANYNPTFKKAVIENIFVTTESRGKGIGQKLIQEVLKKLKKIGCEYICLFTEMNNKKAIQFYEKMGFKKGINCSWMDKVLSKEFER